MNRSPPVVTCYDPTPERRKKTSPKHFSKSPCILLPKKKDAETSHTTKTYPNIIATQNNPFFSRIKILSVSMFNRLTFQLTYPLHGFRLGSSDLPMPRRWRSPCSRASFQPSHLATAEAPLVGWWSHDAVMEFLIDVGKIGIYYDNSWDSMGYT